MRVEVGLSQQRLASRKRRRVIFVAVLFLLAFSSIVTTFSLASFLPEFMVKQVKIEGVNRENQKLIEAQVENFSSKNIFGIFSGRNIFLYRAHFIEDLLLENFLTLESVNVTRQSLNSVVVVVKERVPNALWCSTPSKSNATSTEIDLNPITCFEADENGFIFKPFNFSNISSNNLVVFYTLDVLKKAGDYILPVNRFRDFGYFLHEMKTLDLEVASLTVADDMLFVFPRKGGKLILDPNKDLTQAPELITSLKNSKELGFGTNTFMQKLDYFDLRYTGKAVYRMK